MNKKIFVLFLVFTLIFTASLSSIVNLGNISAKSLCVSEKILEPIYYKQTYMVEMRDGINLATDVYYPDDMSVPHGSILIRTPYNKGNTNMGDWADEGWPTIVQDMRGRYQSEGVDTVFRNAHTDGPDTLSWIVSQDWSNGKVATFGGSALGINQYYMAGANPIGLACQYIQVATPNLYAHGIYQGGQFRKNMIEKWLEGQGSLFVLPELIENENYTLDFWTNTSLDDNWGDVNVPAIHVGGWYDCFAQGTVDGFMGYQYLGGDDARGNSKLIMGPWVHGASRNSGQLKYPENAMPVFPFELFVDMIYKFCEDDSYNGPVDYDTWPSVSYYTMSDVDKIDSPGNEWRFADSWPITDNQVSWFLHEAGVLSKDTPDDNQPLSYSYDPNDPVPTVGGQNLVLANGPYDQRSVEDRDDVLVFKSEVFSEPYEATGPIKARLFVTSNRVDTDFTVKLIDVYPDGRTMLITDGILRMRNREGFDHWEFIQPGEIYEIEIDLWSTSYVWDEGHRLQIDISSSNYPRFLNNPNTADAIYANTESLVAENTVYLDSQHPSCIILPEVDYPDSNPPSKPSIPQGPARGKHGQEYTYSTSAIDPESDDIYVIFNWGDGSNTGWIGPYSSGDEIRVSHTYQGTGEKNYELTVKAKDINGKQSEWSDPFSIVMPKNKMYDFDLLIKIFERIFSNIQFIQDLIDN